MKTIDLLVLAVVILLPVLFLFRLTKWASDGVDDRKRRVKSLIHLLVAITYTVAAFLQIYSPEYPSCQSQNNDPGNVWYLLLWFVGLALHSTWFWIVMESDLARDKLIHQNESYKK